MKPKIQIITNQGVEDEIASAKKMLFYFKLSFEFMQTDAGRQAIELLENGDDFGAQKIIFDNMPRDDFRRN